MPRFWLRHCANVSIERPVISATCSVVNNRADARELPGGDSAGPWPPVLAAKAGEFEKYKTSTQFDGTTQNPQWLG